VKVNAVVRRGLNDHTVPALLERFRGTPVIVRLIEYMDVGTAMPGDLPRWCRRPSCSPRSAVAGRSRALPGSYRREVAERYRYGRRRRRDRASSPR